MSIGNLGQYFTPLEEDLVLKRFTDRKEDDEGYLTQNKADDINFKGIISPHQSTKRFETQFEPTPLGGRHTGDAVLYVRLDQEGVPEIKLEDFIYENNTQITWKVVKEMDYSQAGNVRVYEIIKVKPDA